jgi:hypothetical protein
MYIKRLLCELEPSSEIISVNHIYLDSVNEFSSIKLLFVNVAHESDKKCFQDFDNFRLKIVYKVSCTLHIYCHLLLLFRLAEHI